MLLGKEANFSIDSTRFRALCWNIKSSSAGSQSERNNHCEHARAGHKKLGISIRVLGTPTPPLSFSDSSQKTVKFRCEPPRKMICRNGVNSGFQGSPFRRNQKQLHPKHTRGEKNSLSRRTNFVLARSKGRQIMEFSVDEMICV